MNKYVFMVMADTNPYIAKLNSLLGEVKGWMFAIIGTITAVIVIKHGIEYQQGSSMQKTEAIDNIRKTLIMGGGIFFLAWLATYVVSKMQ